MYLIIAKETTQEIAVWQPKHKFTSLLISLQKQNSLLYINNSKILVALLLTLLKNTVYSYFFLRFQAD